MKKSVKFYHAGCPVCQDAEQNIAHSFDQEKFNVEFVHLGENKSRIKGAEDAGVKSVPALVMDGNVYHINFGADISALK